MIGIAPPESDTSRITESESPIAKLRKESFIPSTIPRIVTRHVLGNFESVKRFLHFRSQSLPRSSPLGLT